MNEGNDGGLRRWRHKHFNARPKLSDSDGPIGAMRRWASRFFPELGKIVSLHSDLPDSSS